jgi:hypothetical protein
MALRERYESLVNEQAEEQRRIRFEEIARANAQTAAENKVLKERYEIYSDKLDSERPAILESLELKMVKLRKLGIVGILEEFVDSNLGGMYARIPEVGRKLALRDEAARNAKVLALHTYKGIAYYNASWHVEPVHPKLDKETLRWSDTDYVHLTIQRSQETIFNVRSELIQTERVDFKYNGSTLEIVGDPEEGPTFQGRVPRLKETRLEVVEDSLARALIRPLIIKPQPKRELSPLEEHIQMYHHGFMTG